jgi:exodeoxyribonuclease V alpha subunit
VLSVGVALGNLLYLYTGVTRGERLVVLVGQKKAVVAVRNVSGRRRWSKLAEWLRPGSAN